MSLAIMISLYPSSNNADVDNPVITRNKGQQADLVVPLDAQGVDEENDEIGE